MSAVAAADEIRADRRGDLGVLTIDRPQALNAMTLDMARAMSARLAEWERDASVRAILIEGEGPRAFCAGGDVRALRGWAMDGDLSAVDAFYRAMYQLTARIARMMTPTIAVAHGAALGGGFGLSVHARYRIGGPSTVLATPETRLGLAINLGASYVYSRTPAHVGARLALTGARIGPEDALAAHLVDYLIPEERMADVRAALAEADLSHRADEAICEILAVNACAPGAAPLAPHSPELEAAFGASTLDATLAALDSGSSWARAEAAAIRSGAPIAVRATHRLLRTGVDADLEDALRLEFRVTSALAARPDFREGVRARLVDRDDAPRWSPPTLDAVDDAELAAAFAPRAGAELLFR